MKCYGTSTSKLFQSLPQWLRLWCNMATSPSFLTTISHTLGDEGNNSSRNTALSEVSNRVLSGKSFVPACKYILTRWYVCLFVYLFVCLFVYPSRLLFFLRQIMSFTSVVRAHNISLTASPTSIIYTYKNPTWLIC